MIRQAATCLTRRWNPSHLGAASQRYNGGVQIRLLAASSKAKAPPPPPPARPAPAASAPRDKAQEAIDKSERLHSELKEMIEAQKAIQAEENQRPFGSNFISFLKASKPEIVNIFFAFVCVLLAYQIHGMRAGIRKLLAEKEEKDGEIDRLRNILANLSEGNNNASGSAEDGESEANYNDDSFSAQLAQKCADVVRTIFEQSEKRVGYSWILGKKLASGDAMELEKLTDELYPVILNEVQSAVGDAAFTPEELKERRVAALKKENTHNELSFSSQSTEALDGTGSRSSVGVRKGDAQMGELMEILDEVHNQDLTDERSDDNNAPSTKVRRTRYAI